MNAIQSVCVRVHVLNFLMVQKLFINVTVYDMAVESH